MSCASLEDYLATHIHSYICRCAKHTCTDTHRHKHRQTDRQTHTPMITNPLAGVHEEALFQMISILLLFKLKYS